MSMISAYQVTTFVPEGFLEPLIESVLQQFPLRYGKYQGLCWWSAPGTEQFTPVLGASPAQGVVGKQEQVRSIAVHFIIPESKQDLSTLIEECIRPVHPWEEPVIIAASVLVSALVA